MTKKKFLEGKNYLKSENAKCSNFFSKILKIFLILNCRNLDWNTFHVLMLSYINSKIFPWIQFTIFFAVTIKSQNPFSACHTWLFYFNIFVNCLIYFNLIKEIIIKIIVNFEEKNQHRSIVYRHTQKMHLCKFQQNKLKIYSYSKKNLMGKKLQGSDQSP